MVKCTNKHKRYIYRSLLYISCHIIFHTGAAAKYGHSCISSKKSTIGRSTWNTKHIFAFSTLGQTNRISDVSKWKGLARHQSSRYDLYPKSFQSNKSGHVKEFCYASHAEELENNKYAIDLNLVT